MNRSISTFPPSIQIGNFPNKICLCVEVEINRSMLPICTAKRDVPIL